MARKTFRWLSKLQSKQIYLIRCFRHCFLNLCFPKLFYMCMYEKKKKEDILLNYRYKYFISTLLQLFTFYKK